VGTLGVWALPVEGAVAAGGSPSNATGGTDIGLQAGFSTGNLILDDDGPTLARDLATMSSAGGRWLRLNFSRANMQPTPTSFNWAPTDRVVAAASALGFKIIAVVSYTPVWDRPSGTDWQWGPTNPGHFAAFAAAAAARYAPRGVRVWEIWNEPNTSQFWSPQPSPAAYARLLQATSSAIRATAPGVTILSGGLAAVATTTDGADISPTAFLSSVYQAGAASAFDGVAAHPYSYPYLPTDAAGGPWNGFSQLLQLRQIMVANGDSSKSIWLTEYGAPTGTSPQAVSQIRQATMVEAAFQQARKWPWVAVLLWYAPRDNGIDATSADDNFGLVSYDFVPKPSLAAFRFAALGRPWNA
jgi:hypothetical protein